MLKLFLPDQYVHSIYDIQLEEMKARGIKGIIADLDNTLVGAKEPLANPRLEEWFAQVKSFDMQLMIVSNNNEYRVNTFAEPLALPFISAARKPANRAFHQALKQMRLLPDETVVVGDQLLTDICGGNRLGLHTIWVQPVSLKEDGFFTRINRRVERFVLARLKRKGWLKWETENESR